MIAYDAIVIGTGQAGPTLASRLTRAGMKVAVVERGLFGGTCVNTGCIPTKTMYTSAYALHAARRAAEFGVVIEGRPVVDMKRVKARKDMISAASRDGLEAWLMKMRGCTVYRGHARFESPGRVRVNDQELAAERIFINVGGRAAIPAMPGIDRVPYLTNSSMMGLDFVPEHLVIVGGSYVGLEFGQMFRRFGSEVTLIEKAPRLIHREDEDVSVAIRETLEKEGVRVRVDARCIAFSKAGDGVVAHVDCSEGSPAVAGTHVLLAVGRRPNTDDLGLERAGIDVDARGYIVVDDELRTSAPGVWALGDCNGKGAFTHTAFNDEEIVAANLLGGDKRRVSDRITAYALFVDPPLGRAGMTESEAMQRGGPVLVAKRAMKDVKRAVEKGETDGFMKIVVDANSGRILGAAILGTGGDEVIHCILDVMYAGVPFTVLERAMHIHPTVSELVPTMLGSLEPVKAAASRT